MLLRRFALALKKQDWAAVIIEFFLVAAGVLLALYLNNLNQQANEAKLLQNYLSQLVLDLEQDIADNERVQSITVTQDDEARYLLAAINQTNVEPLDSTRLVRATLKAGYANLPIINSITFDELVSTGNMRLFKDAALKREVMLYYSRSQTGQQWNPLIQAVQTDYRRITRDLLNHEQFAWARRNAFDEPDSEIALDMSAYLAEARSNPKLPGVIAAMAEIQQRIRGNASSQARDAKALIAKIKAATAP